MPGVVNSPSAVEAQQMMGARGARANRHLTANSRPIPSGATRPRAAAVRLQKLQIGPIVVTDVPALIDDGDLRHPLLGMEFLKRLSTVEFKNGTLTIHGS